MKKDPFFSLKFLLFILCTGIGYSCNTHRDTAMSRKMQNLTSRYNYIYNSKAILHNHLLALTENYQQNYSQILPTYLGPETDNTMLNSGMNLKSMDEIIRKAKIIILEKSFSNYTDDAYILLGKANFFNGNYFDAAEYFDYTARTFKSNQPTYIEALDWKARSLLKIKRMAQASVVLDTLDSILPEVSDKKLRAEPLATLAQMAIVRANDTAAIAYLESALDMSRIKNNSIRWTYILAQLYEKQGQSKPALGNYRKVQRSNAPFEMYFNAKLNEIAIISAQNGRRTNKQEQLMTLLKDDKNLDYVDQIYFRIAESYADDEDYDMALKNYLLSAQQSTRSEQKGLSYLRLANLYLNNLRDYRSAKTYFDSTINILPASYPGYDLVAKKNANLQYLTNRYDLITLQDTLQAIANLPEQFRPARIRALANPLISAQASMPEPSAVDNRQFLPSSRELPPNTFYFSNTSAISIGFSDFKRIWGNRKLEDNWRQSVKATNLATGHDMVDLTTSPADPDMISSADDAIDSIITKYSAAIPVTPLLLAQSDQKIIDAYYEIANFYLHELKDYKEANTVYQKLLERYPKNNHLASTYYSLYLINRDTDPSKASAFKNKVLTLFPDSDHAKAIADPDFSLKQSTLEAYLFNEYNEIFKQYESRNFKEVILKVDEVLNLREQNPLSAQLAYLKAIAVGRTGPVDSLLTELNQIVQTAPQDSLIAPLAISHINYINSHIDVFKPRKIALIDRDFNETTFPEPSIVAIIQPQTIVKQSNPVSVPVQVKDSVTIQTDGLFSNVPSTLYYYVIAVADASLTLSSSRFGVGQFNRGNYPGSQLRHQLKEFDNDQLIYVGNFSNFEDVKSYATAITPQLKQIMKVPVNIYNSFIISKENFDKLVSKDVLDRYIGFYKNHY